jgi:hypothetical protein
VLPIAPISQQTKEDRAHMRAQRVRHADALRAAGKSPRQISRQLAKENKEPSQLAIAASDVRLVASWLNEAHGKSRKKVMEIGSQMQSLLSEQAAIRDTHSKITTTLRQRHAGKRVGRLDEAAAVYKRKVAEFVKRQNDLNAVLAAYTFRPAVDFIVVADLRIAGLMAVSSARSRVVVGDRTISEADAVFYLTKLYLTDRLQMLRLCKFCKERWVAATKSHYQFCSKCRGKTYAGTDEFREKRRKIQKAYRQRLKQKAQNEMNAVKRKGGK